MNENSQEQAAYYTVFYNSYLDGNEQCEHVCGGVKGGGTMYISQTCGW